MERGRDTLAAEEAMGRKRETQSDRERKRGGGRFGCPASRRVFDVIQEVSSVTPSLRLREGQEKEG